jgi:hypothetical protein
MARARKPATKRQAPASQAGVLLYTLEVFLLSGQITEKFAKKNRVVSRTIQIRGDQTLEDLHRAIFDAFGRWEEHMYEFQFGEGPMESEAPRYVLPGAFEMGRGEENPPAGRVDETRIDSLGLRLPERARLHSGREEAQESPQEANLLLPQQEAAGEPEVRHRQPEMPLLLGHRHRTRRREEGRRAILPCEAGVRSGCHRDGAQEEGD